MIDTTTGFDEAAYLKANPDVEKAVQSGAFSSGWDHYRQYGKNEGRQGRRPGSEMSRIDKALEALNLSGLGLEIGPSHNPIAPKKRGHNVQILDHLSAEELRKKYAGHEAFGVELGNIEEVDFVWHGQPLPELIGKRACYDWIIASHVIEHVPDLVSFLQQCEAILKPGGMLSLIVPDRRYCFDYFGRATSTGDLLDAFNDKRTRPSSGKIFDHIANAVQRDGKIAWGAENQNGTPELMHSFAQARDQWESARRSSEYVDVHCWRFTLESFRLIVTDLQNLGLIGLGVALERGPHGCEFFVTMSTEQTPRSNDRLSALNAIHDSGA